MIINSEISIMNGYKKDLSRSGYIQVKIKSKHKLGNMTLNTYWDKTRMA